MKQLLDVKKTGQMQRVDRSILEHFGRGEDGFRKNSRMLPSWHATDNAKRPRLDGAL
jgi:hypothetical protein